MKVLVVEDDEILRRALVHLLQQKAQQVAEADSVSEAAFQLAQDFDLVILDINLPDGRGSELAEVLATKKPMPAVIAISGEATPSEAFHLHECGVIAYLPKPFSLTDFCDTLEQLIRRAPNLSPLAASAVGKKSLREVNLEVRKSMLEQALSVSKGNRTHAAELLNVSRQAVQQMISDFGIDITEYRESQ